MFTVHNQYVLGNAKNLFEFPAKPICQIQNQNKNKMDQRAYKSFHELFVSNNKGTTLLEVNLISLLCPLSVLLLAKLNSTKEPVAHIDEEEDEIFFGEKNVEKKSITKFASEFGILVIPLWVAFTNVAPSLWTVLFFSILVLSICLYSRNESQYAITSSINSGKLGKNLKILTCL